MIYGVHPVYGRENGGSGARKRAYQSKAASPYQGADIMRCGTKYWVLKNLGIGMRDEFSGKDKLLKPLFRMAGLPARL